MRLRECSYCLRRLAIFTWLLKKHTKTVLILEFWLVVSEINTNVLLYKD